jgi:hypothetical protein
LENQEKKPDGMEAEKIPKGFFEFVYSQSYTDFMESLLEYLREMLRLEK